MELPVNAFKRALGERRLQIGLWSQLCSPIAAEVLAGAGFDWVVIDTEHAPNELPAVMAQLQALDGGTDAVLRELGYDPARIEALRRSGVI